MPCAERSCVLILCCIMDGRRHGTCIHFCVRFCGALVKSTTRAGGAMLMIMMIGVYYIHVRVCLSLSLSLRWCCLSWKPVCFDVALQSARVRIIPPQATVQSGVWSVWNGTPPATARACGDTIPFHFTPPAPTNISFIRNAPLNANGRLLLFNKLKHFAIRLHMGYIYMCNLIAVICVLYEIPPTLGSTDHRQRHSLILVCKANIYTRYETIERIGQPAHSKPIYIYMYSHMRRQVHACRPRLKRNGVSISYNDEHNIRSKCVHKIVLAPLVSTQQMSSSRPTNKHEQTHYDHWAHQIYIIYRVLNRTTKWWQKEKAQRKKEVLLGADAIANQQADGFGTGKQINYRNDVYTIFLK